MDQTLTSLEVAEMIGKEHKRLLKDIRIYIGYLNEGKIAPVDFFLESTYIDAKGEERPNYLLTKQGCEMVSNKLTGAKGVQFTAKYVSRFNQMEAHIKEQQVITNQNLSPELQLMQGFLNQLGNHEQELKRLDSKVDRLSEIFNTPIDTPVVEPEPLKKILYTTREIAEGRGFNGASGANHLHKILHDKRVIYPRRSKNRVLWHLYAEHRGKGYKVTTSIVDGMKWTVEGKKFIENILDKEGE